MRPRALERRLLETQGQPERKRTCGRTFTKICGPHTHWIENYRLPILIRVLPLTICEFREVESRDGHIPATIIPFGLSSVPMLTNKPPGIFARSSISSGDVAMIGEAPSAIVAFADCVATTIFVISLDHQRVVRTEVSGRTWCTNGDSSRTDLKASPISRLRDSVV